MANDDWGALQLVDDAPYVLDDGGNGQRLYGRGVFAQRLDLDSKAWVSRSEHAVAATLVALYPLLPATWGNPEAVDQDDVYER